MPSAWIPCQVRVRRRQKEELLLHLRASNEGCEVELQARRQGCLERSRREGSSQEASAKKKKPNEERKRGGVSTAHTKGLGNVEEGRIAEQAVPRKRQRKRPKLGSQFKNLN